MLMVYLGTWINIKSFGQVASTIIVIGVRIMGMHVQLNLFLLFVNVMKFARDRNLIVPKESFHYCFTNT